MRKEADIEEYEKEKRRREQVSKKSGSKASQSTPLQSKAQRIGLKQ